MINLGQQDVKLQEEIVLGHYQKALSEEIMITQEDIFGVNVGEPWTPGEVEQEVLKGNGKGLSTSPMDIDPREPIQLRDAEVTPKHRKAFEDLCSEFIVCQQLTPGIILGRDFLSRNQLGITWGPEGTLQLRDKQDPSVQTAEEVTNPTVKLAAKTVIPPRSLVLVTVSTTLPPCKDKTHFDFVPTQTNFLLGPNCIVYPLDYASIKGGLQK